jgi:hypothetical protein
VSSSELVAVVEAIRAALPLDPEWAMMNALSSPLEDASDVGDAPASYLNLLQVADGFICGPVVLFDSRTVASMQFYSDPVEGSTVPINKEDWYCVGVINDEPWFVNRSDESVWTFPDAGVVWWMSDRFERAAPSIEDFFLNVVCGPSYPSLTSAEAGDQWWNLLAHLGRVA